MVLPVWQDQQLLHDADSLLAQPIYEKICQLIGIQLEKTNSPSKLISREGPRSHQTILISGDRGTGKSAVLANLRTYIEQLDSPQQPLAKRLLILNPVDPTLLDAEHDLLLNIIVAAIIRDPAVSHRLEINDNATLEFYAGLHKLGAALEVVQTRSEKYGLERLRSFMGNHGLADEIHKFFHHTLTLMEKDLIILPIDDVDTSLNHAFENLEIVRKYLSSSLILPIISGDIKLYHEVIWRDMHGRMLKDSRAEEENAIIKAKSLAQEYEIKVLPLSRRLSMPKIDEYLKNSEIFLLDNRSQKYQVELMPLPTFVAWIEALLNERVNGVENSKLKFPVRSLRLLSQLISTTRNEICHIAPEIPANALEVRRSLFMPTSILSKIDDFTEKLAATKLARGEAKKQQKTLAFKLLYDLSDSDNGSNRSQTYREWATALTAHFRSQHDAGAPYLILSTWLTWLNIDDRVDGAKFFNSENNESRLLNTPLFMPTMHHLFDEFDQQYELADSWRKQIPEKFAPESWFTKLPTRAILPYPLPELGRQMSALGRSNTLKDHKFSDALLLLRMIMTHRNFYSRSEKTAMVFCGRLFEIVISSFVRDLTSKDLISILDDHPFYSLTMLANTKTFDFASDDDDLLSTAHQLQDREQRDHTIPEQEVLQLQKQIEIWRRKNKISQPHPWIFYNVMNKFYNQVALFNAREDRNNSQGSINEMVITATKAFNALWATFGSFEKGPLFGFDATIAYQNVGSGEFTRSPLYHTNVSPFIDLPAVMNSYTRALASHPLRKLIEKVRAELPTLDNNDESLSRLGRRINSKTRT